MNHLFQTDEEDEERQWLEGMENQDEPEIKEAVRIQDSISKMMMTKPLTVELGTSLRHVLDQMQDYRWIKVAQIGQYPLIGANHKFLSLV